ncbi:TonB-dependent receptor [Terriglobus roseus]|uniref:Carboxypeptidase regulatory-like domain-containing protein n=1 Tax=Terriglobus roseus TaxID=392734 RepID=A0A1G7FME0_9BACT|nr:carboxypeptidase regulatory-like domain-containing protein [Terriglobus roseus]SDE76805.1 Carboxypeptidase regulatory-like domain-containing protein [Terriglobus roseus]
MTRFSRSLYVSIAVAATSIAHAQTTATLSGVVKDPQGALIPNATVTVHSNATGAERSVTSGNSGEYVLPSLQPGEYTVTVAAAGFATFKVEKFVLQVDQKADLPVQLSVGAEGVTVQVEGGGAPVIDAGSMTVGQVIDKTTVQEIPLNGRHFLDLTVLTPGGVTAPANGNLTAPSRGVGAFSFLTAGNRDDSVNFQINGINLNDISNAQIVFQPSINTTSEVKINNSTPSAEYGRNSGSVTNVSTRSGDNQFHGEVFEYVRNNSFDARNFFNPRGQAQVPLKRHNFGASVGGPIWRNKTFFFASYEALRQHQGLSVNTIVLTDAQRAGVTDPISLQLMQFIPESPGGVYTGFINGPVNIDQGTMDILHIFNQNDTLHGFYAFQEDIRTEPTTQGNTLPGFGDHRPGYRQIATINETHVFSPSLINEFRLGANRVNVSFISNFTQGASSFGMNNFPAGVTPAAGIPQTSISTTGINIGGPSGFPSGRIDTLGALSDALTYTHGKHSVKFGGEYRRYLNANFSQDAGTLSFGPSAALTTTGGATVTPARTAIQNFQLGRATGFSITPQPNTSRVFGNALGAFVQDTWKVTPNLTIEAGFRFEWFGTPTLGAGKATIFNPADQTLNPVGAPGYKDLYSQNYNYMPRLGFTYDPFGSGNTVLRGGYSIAADQPLSGLVTTLSANPPYTNRVSYTATASGTFTQGSSTYLPTIPLSALYASAAATAISVGSVQNNYKNGTVQSYNLNLQQALPMNMALSVGYYGSVGRHLRQSLNVNQISPTTSARNFTKISASSPISPNASLNTNVTQASSIGQSNYNAMWLNVRKNMARGFQVNATYQLSKSLDLGSGTGTQFTDSTRPYLNYGPSDFDTRHRISGNAVYQLPFKGNRLVKGYQISGILQWQTGNPLNITTTSTFTGTSGVQHPTLLQAVQYRKDYVYSGTSPTVRWFASGGSDANPGGSVCTSVTSGCTFYTPSTGFGTMGRNALVGPGFANFDLSLAKNTKIVERVAFQLKVDMFDLFNHPSFGNPGTTAQSGATFGVITATRFPIGDLGSSRQLQISGKLTF